MDKKKCEEEVCPAKK